MAYRGSEAYDFSLFEPQIIEQPKRVSKSSVKTSVKGAPAERTAPRGSAAPVRRAEPVKKAPQRKTNTINVNNYQQTIQRNTSSAVIPAPVKKAMCFVCLCFAMMTVLLVMQTKCDTLMTEIASVQKQIDIAEGENVRLNAELSSMISSDKIENYAENVLGMVKAESYQISYVDLSDGDEIVVSGDKTTEETTNLGDKLKALFAYLG